MTLNDLRKIQAAFVLEALVLVIQQFSLSCEVPPVEIARDLLSLIEKEES